MSRIYPRKVWVLLPSFKPKEVEVVKRYGSATDYGDLTAAGVNYMPSEMYESQQEAVENGYRRLCEQQSALDKRQANLRKKRATLAAFVAGASK